MTRLGEKTRGLCWQNGLTVESDKKTRKTEKEMEGLYISEDKKTEGLQEEDATRSSVVKRESIPAITPHEVEIKPERRIKKKMVNCTAAKFLSRSQLY